eukprot:TRINITY_DN7816_c0_g1_i2.p1 TRINITY_DN7816_c0_g1~~TRINITY_DN7816_c0_g1_i2.p1  ORF type:complete len:190 (+),score=29.21 TRINITY_DN7816_c0_g1_i2:22-570(+)
MESFEFKGDFLEFLHILADDLCGRKGLASYPAFEEHDGKPFAEAYKTLLKKLVGRSTQTTKEGILEDLKSINNTIPEKYRESIVECVSSRREDILPALINSSSHISQAHLQDFDWKLQLIVSSDKISTISEPVLLLDVHINESSAQPKKQILLELPKEDLDSLIEKLELINQNVQELKVYDN